MWWVWRPLGSAEHGQHFNSSIPCKWEKLSAAKGSPTILLSKLTIVFANFLFPQAKQCNPEQPHMYYSQRTWTALRSGTFSTGTPRCWISLSVHVHRGHGKPDLNAWNKAVNLRWILLASTASFFIWFLSCVLCGTDTNVKSQSYSAEKLRPVDKFSKVFLPFLL